MYSIDIKRHKIFYALKRVQGLWFLFSLSEPLYPTQGFCSHTLGASVFCPLRKRRRWRIRSNKPRNRSLHIREHVCLITRHSLTPVILRGKKRRLQARTTTKVVLRLKLKYLFTNPGYDFETQRI